MAAGQPVRVEGLADLRRTLKLAGAKVPRELNTSLKVALKDVELVASARTPRDEGGLQAANRLTTRGANVVLTNRKPYANTIHWGRKTIVRGGVRYPSPVAGRAWFTDTLREQEDQVAERVLDEIERFISRL